MLITVVAVASVLACAAYVIAGRLAGLAIAAMCSAIMAFFLMPPLFSLRVSRTQDILVLMLYGSAGLVLAKTAPFKMNRGGVRVDPTCNLSRKRFVTEVSGVVAELMSSDLRVHLCAVDLSFASEGLTLPCTQGETVRILSDVLTMALKNREVRRVSINGTQRPCFRGMIVAAQYVWPLPKYKVITIGKRDEDCEPATFPGWPLHWQARWFDNGYECIYQISVEAKLPSALAPGIRGEQ